MVKDDSSDGLDGLNTRIGSIIGHLFRGICYRRFCKGTAAFRALSTQLLYYGAGRRGSFKTGDVPEPVGVATGSKDVVALPASTRKQQT